MNSYLRKYGYIEASVDSQPEQGLGIVVVVPACGETDILHTLSAIYNCHRPPCPVEVLIVINASEDADLQIHIINRLAYKQVCQWKEQSNETGLSFHIIFENHLPARHAGVGLARKIGMDEAVRRIYLSGNDDQGIIACLDADTTCDPNYLIELYRHFHENSRTPGCSIHFEYPTFGTEYEPLNYLAISYYELNLRYYNLALKCAGFPHAHHTLGTAMAVRSKVYQREGGMNRRAFDDDFHFIQKIIAIGNYSELHSTKVYPSPRTSHRIPYGSGRAVSDYVKSSERGFYTYNLQSFRYLRIFFKNIPEFYLAGAKLVTLGGVLPYIMIDFLHSYFFDERIEEIRNNSSNFNSFEKRFYRWFNAFMVQKFVQFVRDNAHKNVRVERASLELLRDVGYGNVHEIKSLNELILTYRNIESGGHRNVIRML